MSNCIEKEIINIVLMGLDGEITTLPRKLQRPFISDYFVKI